MLKRTTLRSANERSRSGSTDLSKKKRQRQTSSTSRPCRMKSLKSSNSSGTYGKGNTSRDTSSSLTCVPPPPTHAHKSMRKNTSEQRFSKCGTSKHAINQYIKKQNKTWLQGLFVCRYNFISLMRNTFNGFTTDTFNFPVFKCSGSNVQTLSN